MCLASGALEPVHPQPLSRMDSCLLLVYGARGFDSRPLAAASPTWSNSTQDSGRVTVHILRRVAARADLSLTEKIATKGKEEV